MNPNNLSFNSAPSIENAENQLEKNIRTLEQINCSLDMKATMVVVQLGVKPSATIDIYKHEEDVDSIKKKMADAGLYFDDMEQAPFRNKYLAASLAIAKSQEAATQLATLFRSERSDNNNIELGKSLGYPATSTEAYIGRREKYERGLNPFVERRIPSNLQFMLSKDKWEEELQSGIAWIKALKEASPETYQKMIEARSSEYDGVPLIVDY